MATLVKFQDFAEQLGKGIHDLSADTIKVFLTNTAPNASTNDELADITQIAYTNISGGVAPTITKQYTETGGTDEKENKVKKRRKREAEMLLLLAA